MATTIIMPGGKLIATCFRTFFFPSRFVLQYCIKSFSSFVNIRPKIKYFNRALPIEINGLYCKHNIYNVKLSPILAKYLSANKQLSLPGIGTFHLENAFDPDFDGKKPVPLKNISFSQEKPDTISDDVIEFISRETGKMKVLATSDLSSQLDDVLQFINTGKPYYFDGIGTVAKKSNGHFEFFPEKHTIAPEKKKEKDIPMTEKNIVPQSYIDNTHRRSANAKPAIIIITLSLIAIAATVWLYIKNTEADKNALHDITNKDTTTPVIPQSPGAPDSAVTQAGTATFALQNGTYTYVLEVAKEPRATKRYNQLKTIKWPVELEIVDSVYKRIVMKLPAAGADTTRAKDSLRILSGRAVYIIR